jgi:hypothetical protein
MRPAAQKLGRNSIIKQFACRQVRNEKGPYLTARHLERPVFSTKLKHLWHGISIGLFSLPTFGPDGVISLN